MDMFDIDDEGDSAVYETLIIDDSGADKPIIINSDGITESAVLELNGDVSNNEVSVNLLNVNFQRLK